VEQGPLLDRKVFSLTLGHHKHRETERIVRGAKSSFSPLPRNRSALKRSLTMEKGTSSTIYENHRF